MYDSPFKHGRVEYASWKEISPSILSGIIEGNNLDWTSRIIYRN